jgi:hypothetical protein
MLAALRGRCSTQEVPYGNPHSADAPATRPMGTSALDPLDPPLVGIVGGLIFGNPDLAIVRWVGVPWTFEPEATLVEFLRRWQR